MGVNAASDDNGENRYPGTHYWRKSSYSASNGHCVEATVLENGLDGLVGVRDSRAAESPVLSVRPAHWSNFTATVRAL